MTILEMTYHHLCHGPLVIQTNLDVLREETLQVNECQEQGMVGAILKTGYLRN